MAVVKLVNPIPVIDALDQTLGCPVANGGAPCNHLCGGGWPGTKITHHRMLKALQRRRIVPECLQCGPLQEQAKYWYRLHANDS